MAGNSDSKEIAAGRRLANLTPNALRMQDVLKFEMVGSAGVDEFDRSIGFRQIRILAANGRLA